MGRKVLALLVFAFLVAPAGVGLGTSYIPVYTADTCGASTLVTDLGGYFQYLPANNLDPLAGVIAGAWDGTKLCTRNATATLSFTTAGGNPTVGARAYLASGQDDSNTGIGKATAAVPTLAVPLYPLQAQNIVWVGTVLSFNAGAHTGLVRLDGDLRPNYTAIADSSASFNRVTFPLPTGTNKWSRAGDDANLQWQSGQSLIIRFTVDQPNDSAAHTHSDLLWNYSTDGWAVFTNVNGSDLQVSQGLNEGHASPVPGLNTVAMTKTGGLIRFRLNGNAVTTVVDSGAAVPAGTIAHIGCSDGGLLGYVFINRVLSDAELLAATRPDFTPGTRAPYQIGSTWTADSSTRNYFDATAYASGTPTATAGPVGSSYTWTVAGTPIVKTTTLTRKWALADKAIDGPPAGYDSLFAPYARAFQRIEVQTSDFFEMTTIVGGFSSTDTDNGDEGAAVFAVNEVPVAQIIGADDRTIYYQNPVYFSLAAGGNPMAALWAFSPPYKIAIYYPDRINRGATDDSGGVFNLVLPSSATFNDGTTTRRLVAIGDGRTLGGHEQDLLPYSPYAGAPLVRIRSQLAYPGRVTATPVSVRGSLAVYLDFANGDIAAYAKWIVAQAKEGAPTRRDYLFVIGYADWNADLPLATFASTSALLVDTIHALDPTAHAIAMSKVPNVSIYAATNGLGTALSAFDGALVGLMTGRSSWLTRIDLTGPNTITWADTGHPDFAGQLAIAQNIKADSSVGW